MLLIKKVFKLKSTFLSSFVTSNAFSFICSCSSTSCVFLWLIRSSKEEFSESLSNNSRRKSFNCANKRSLSDVTLLTIESNSWACSAPAWQFIFRAFHISGTFLAYCAHIITCKLRYFHISDEWEVMQWIRWYLSDPVLHPYYPTYFGTSIFQTISAINIFYLEYQYKYHPQNSGPKIIFLFTVLYLSTFIPAFTRPLLVHGL